MSVDSDALQRTLTKMGSDVQRQLRAALESLAHGNLGLADRVVRNDAEINRLRYDIEAAVTGEFESGHVDRERVRFLLCAIHVVGDLERIGDHAEGIAKVALMLGDPRPIRVTPSLVELGSMVEKMLAAGMQAFELRDEQRSRELCKYDDVIDAHYDALCGEQLSLMAETVSEMTMRTYLLWAGHNLERVADRVTNICERTVYLASGSVEELNISNF